MRGILICVESRREESQSKAQGPIYFAIDSLTQTLAVNQCSRLASLSSRVPPTTLRASSKALEETELRCLGDVEDCISLVDDHFDVIENTGYIKDAAEDS